jgi:hypothetical protein
MKRLFISIWLAVVTGVLADTHGERPWNANLEIGLRSRYFELQDSLRSGDNHFLGSLDEFIEKQDYVPTPMLNIRFGPHWALGLGYDAFRVKTWSRPDPVEGEIGHSDGTIDTSGPSISIQCYYPNRSRYTPYAEASLLVYSTHFDHLDEWRNARGDGNSHIIDIDDDMGYRFGLGCDISLNDNWSLIVTLERTLLEVDVTYYYYGEAKQRTTFPLDHTSYGIGVKYRL